MVIPYRRKRDQRTDYKIRLSLLKSQKQRLVVRKSNKHIVAQVVKYSDEGDVIMKSAHSSELKKFGWTQNTGSLPAAYLTGLLIGTRFKGKEAIVDFGAYTPKKGSRLYAVIKGAMDGGMKIPFSEEVFPKEERISGKHISAPTVELFEKTKKKIVV